MRGSNLLSKSDFEEVVEYANEAFVLVLLKGNEEKSEPLP